MLLAKKSDSEECGPLVRHPGRCKCEKQCCATLHLVVSAFSLKTIALTSMRTNHRTRSRRGQKRAPTAEAR
jgi:hypothetical protein